MVADKVFTIQADFGGVGETPPIIDDDVLAKMEAQAERNAELLGTFIADSYGATGTPEDFKKQKGKAGRPKKKEDEEDLEEAARKASTLHKILDNTQKVVIALNGTNGRVTKAMAVFNRAIKLSSEYVDKYTKAQQENTKAVEADTEKKKEASEAGVGADGGDDGTNPEDKAAEVVAATGLQKVATNAIKAAGVVGTVAAAFTGLAAITYITARLFGSLVDNLKEVVGNLSGALKLAEAQTKIATIEKQMQAANSVGGELAALEDTNREVVKQLIDFKSNMVDAVSGILQFFGEVLVGILKVLNIILNMVNFFLELFQQIVLFILKFLEYIPLIAQIVKPLRRWMESDDINKLRDRQGLAAMIDDLGSINNVGNRDQIKALRKAGFLPPRPRRGSR